MVGWTVCRIGEIWETRKDGSFVQEGVTVNWEKEEKAKFTGKLTGLFTGERKPQASLADTEKGRKKHVVQQKTTDDDDDNYINPSRCVCIFLDEIV